MVELNGGKEDVPKIVNVQAKTLKIETAILICVVIFSIFYLTSSWVLFLLSQQDEQSGQIGHLALDLVVMGTNIELEIAMAKAATVKIQKEKIEPVIFVIVLHYGQIGANVLLLVAKVLNFAQEHAKGVIVMKISTKHSNAAYDHVWIFQNMAQSMAKRAAYLEWIDHLTIFQCSKTTNLKTKLRLLVDYDGMYVISLWRLIDQVD